MENKIYKKEGNWLIDTIFILIAIWAEIMSIATGEFFS